MRVTANGDLFMTDEYGSYICRFNSAGQIIARITVPEKFLITHPSATRTAELLPNNTSGRQADQGMEGRAISPDGNTFAVNTFVMAPEPTSATLAGVELLTFASIVIRRRRASKQERNPICKEGGKVLFPLYFL